jgi:hypothetical protein
MHNYKTITMGKVAQPFGLVLNVQKTLQSKQSTNGRIIARSGHPDVCRAELLFSSRKIIFCILEEDNIKIAENNCHNIGFCV